MSAYDHKAIESKWQEKWESQKLYATPDSLPGKENFYTLVEFPYPSGDLHVGHWYAFAVPDIFARYKRMRGFNVLYPIGFDAFGLPAENAAIKNKVDPSKWTWSNIERMRGQLRLMGNMFDWSREVVACDPAYYKWTQWLFLKLYEKGLAYRGKALVNWDPVDQTVLANEQVLPDGTAERSGAKVEKKELEQWFFRITQYADRLIDDLENLNWPEPIKIAQRNWIGRSEGAEIHFEIKPLGDKLTVFTTRPDTLFGATYVVLAPEHALVEKLSSNIRNIDEVRAYAEAARRKSELERSAEGKEKTGVKLEGITAVNPANGEELPVFIADYVLATYGTGAIMAVPAHDERDFEFAQKYGIAVREVVRGEENASLPYTGAGAIINSGKFDGLSNEEAKRKIAEAVGGKMTKTYRQRDWLLSRQRYWGVPIPVVYDPEGKPHPIPEEHLPWLLPTDVDFTPTGVPPLARSTELLERTERIFGKGWKPEPDTMDTFVDSSWYFLRYLDPKNESQFATLDKQKEWMPVGRYSGGSEHTTMHVLYSRFFYKALYDLGLVTESEPYAVRLNRGLILAEDGRKMSKRWGNVINPDEEVARVGADAVKTYLAFIGPYNEVGSFPWSTNGLIGVRRFLERVADLVLKIDDSAPAEELDRLVHQTIKKVGEDIESMKFNTSVSQLMILSNAFGKMEKVPKTSFETFLRLLAPFAPHLAEELWEKLGHTSSLHLEPWPTFDPGKLSGGRATIGVQVNGKLRATLEVDLQASQESVVSEARGLPEVGKWMEGKEPKKVVYVPGRLISFVV